MKKYLKILMIVMFIGGLICISNYKSFAVIDMNLASNLTSANSTESTNVSNSSNNTTTAINNTTSNSTSTAATVSSVSSSTDSELGLTNILNILLITVGFLLILLGIAILIKLRH